MPQAGSFLDRLFHWVGVENTPVTHRERLVSMLGGVLCIPALFAVSSFFLHAEAALPLVASMGASAVLLFASPHGPLSQPWPLLGGHVFSAIVGVSCAHWIPHPVMASALAVGLSIGAMHYLRCLHPPGGATALVAVIGGPAVSQLGYQFVLLPVALNAVILCLVAIHYNAVFPWRRYPAHLHHLSQPPRRAEFIRHEDFVYALSQIDTYIDVSEEDLLRIYQLAMGHARPNNAPPPRA